MRKYIVILFCLFICLSIEGQARTVSPTRNNATLLGEDAQIFVLTCTPGTEVWSKYGHTAIRIYDSAQNLDIIFNYGIFSLMEEGFYLKFIKGETYYQLGIESHSHFQHVYSKIGRKTYWQELNLSLQQKQEIYDALILNYQPKNRYYLYNFVFDNCATRPYYLIKNVLKDSIQSSYQGAINQPYRSTISHYTGHNSWVDFSINMVFGSKADQPMNNEQRLFLPEELMFYLSQATLADGIPLVKDQYIQPFQVAPVPWYANCWLGLTIFALMLIAISIWDRKRNKLSLWIDITLGVVYVILFSIVIFLTFFSSHPLVGFNWRLFLLPIIHLCARLIYIIR